MGSTPPAPSGSLVRVAVVTRLDARLDHTVAAALEACDSGARGVFTIAPPPCSSIRGISYSGHSKGRAADEVFDRHLATWREGGWRPMQDRSG